MDREEELEAENDKLDAEIVSLRNQANALETVVDEWEAFGDNLLYSLEEVLDRAKRDRELLG